MAAGERPNLRDVAHASVALRKLLLAGTNPTKTRTYLAICIDVY